MRKLQNLISDFSKKFLLKAAAAASVLFLSTALLTLPSFAASAYDNLAVANVTSEPLNMRTKPSTDGDRRKVLPWSGRNRIREERWLDEGPFRKN